MMVTKQYRLTYVLTNDKRHTQTRLTPRISAAILNYTFRPSTLLSSRMFSSLFNFYLLCPRVRNTSNKEYPVNSLAGYIIIRLRIEYKSIELNIIICAHILLIYLPSC